MKIEYNKYADGLVPAIVQDAATNVVLMLGFMNEAAFTATEETGKVTFYSRSKQRLWTKGEESGNHLLVQEILLDCDDDSLLIKVRPLGSVCHKGTDTCWGEKNTDGHFLTLLENIIIDRKEKPAENSYTSSLFAKGINKIAQKVGEEAVELVIEAKDNNHDLFVNEAADLLFHYMILLQAKNASLDEVIQVLRVRHQKH